MAQSLEPSILVVENYPGRGLCIVRLLQQFNVPCHLVTSDGRALSITQDVAGVIISGGPQSVREIGSEKGVRLRPVLTLLDSLEQQQLPILGICLGHQLLGTWAGGKVAKSAAKIFGFQETLVEKRSAIFHGPNERRVLAFKYHEDYLLDLPRNCVVLAHSASCNIEAFQIEERPIWGVQFHPEMTLSDGQAVLQGNPVPLLPWDPQTDVKAPYIIKAFAHLCIKRRSGVVGFAMSN